MTARRSWVGMMVGMMATLAMAADEPVDKKSAKRAAIDEMSLVTVERLVAEDERAAEAYSDSVGYAVFDNFKFTFLLSGGGGVGVAVEKPTGRSTYMKMGSAGLGIGLGGQAYQVVFFFEHTDAFERFINKGWQADVSANAAAGTSGKNAPTTFSDGIAVFQITHKGLVAQADISGTKYWKSKRLNR